MKCRKGERFLLHCHKLNDTSAPIRDYIYHERRQNNQKFSDCMSGVYR